MSSPVLPEGTKERWLAKLSAKLPEGVSLRVLEPESGAWLDAVKELEGRGYKPAGNGMAEGVRLTLMQRFLVWPYPHRATVVLVKAEPPEARGPDIVEVLGELRTEVDDVMAGFVEREFARAKGDG